ncbi:MAG: 30S ribosomal protein S3ae [Candidatus Aenigmarchaeota archaeon]|nr:30S ribosomal protein S3ae [Candidatus Aenigmarchaeota archaeon]
MPVARGKKLKSKAWFTLLAPEYLGSKPLGITPASDAKYVIGRVVESSVMNLTDDYNKYYMKFKFRVDKVDGQNAHTVFYGMECLQDYISRLVRRRTKRIDTIQDVKTKDGVTLRVKTIMITNKTIKSSVVKVLRNFVKKVVEEEVSKATISQVVEKILKDVIKRRILEEGSKIYPIRHFEIRRIDVLSLPTKHAE